MTHYCQSCGMPMENEHYGTNADNSPNEDYCNYCYQNGEFVNPDETVEEMIKSCVPHMVQQGMKENEAKDLLEKMLPTLKRWKTANR